MGHVPELGCLASAGAVLVLGPEKGDTMTGDGLSTPRPSVEGRGDVVRCLEVTSSSGSVSVWDMSVARLLRLFPPGQLSDSS